MPALLLDPEQRFTCGQCGRCCRRGWDIALGPGEADAYRRAGVARFFRVDLGQGEGTDPWEPIPGHAPHLRLRKRTDGACGFLSPENRCRLHEELGADRKPLSCRLFPFRFHPTGGPPVVATSFCCPTVVANEGALLSTQTQQLRSLAQDWFRAYPEAASDVVLVAQRRLVAVQIETVRGVLRELLERKNAEGVPDLGGNVARMAHWLEDLTRYRVTRLDETGFGEYLAVMGRHAARNPAPPPSRPPSLLGRLFFRGFLFTVLAGSERLRDRSKGRFGLRLRVFGLLLHTHGLGPAVGSVRLGAARHSRVDLAEPALAGLAHHYLRAVIETLGTGRRSLLDELAVAVAFLNAALVLARMRAATEGQAAVDLTTLSRGLMEAVDLTHADPETVLGRRLTLFAGGVESLYLFASNRLL